MTDRLRTNEPNEAGTDSEPVFRPAADTVLLASTQQVDELLREGVIERVLSRVTNWGRRSSLWPLLFGTACCFIEMAATAASRYDLGRFGSEIMRASPRQADLMIVPGTVTKKMVPMIVRIYHQMPDPKYVIAMGACAISGGPFKEGYNVVSGIDEFIPVDVYVPGCPPKPEALLFGLMQLQEKIDKQSLREIRQPRPDASRAFPIPLLGPDLIDVRQKDEIRARTRHAIEEVLPVPAAEEPKRRHVPGREPVEEKTLAPGQAVVVPTSDVAESIVARLNEVEGSAEDLGGVIFPVDRVLDVARLLRHELGFDYLANLTSVDYPDRFEVVYHLHATTRTGPPTLLKAALPKDEPTIASVVPVWEGANFQEREVWDLMGIRFDGHPNLQRILLWEGFEGFPLRKDYREPYFEEPAKPFGSRWPEGVHTRAEERNPYGRNVSYPAGFDPTSFAEMDESIPILDATEIRAGIPDAEKLIVSFGPQHPSTHGVFRMVTSLLGETITHVEPVMGYLHRNHEKIGERSLWMQVMPYTDRLDYICSMSNNLGYALAVEKLLGVQVPERAEYIRVIMAEFTRIVNHMLALGTFLNDLGAFFTPVLYAFEEREMILDLFEMTAGSRMMCNYMRFGGVARDLPDGFMERAKGLVEDRLPRSLAEFDRFLTRNEIMVSRSVGVGKLSAEQAINMSITGPMLRASGVPFDVRRAEPYSIYDRFEFDIPVGQNGDTYDRFVVRLKEIHESIGILRQALRDIPSGEVLAGQKRWQIRVPKGEAYARVEAPKGELGFYVVSDGGPNPYRYHVRAPSFINLTALNEMSRGTKIADLIAIFGAVDINMGEVDR